ncbi:MAG: hypothetical protein GY930_04310 [bacterium]|nr:hypothetical protein [bacterium]
MPRTLPEGRAQLSDLCTLLLDSPAGLLPKVENTHAAFLTESGRLKPAEIVSIEEVPTGWLLRLEEPEEFCASETIDRVLLCVDPPVKDHVRVASWLLSDLRNATSVELRPLETHTLPIAWKGIGHMGNLAAKQVFRNVFFSGGDELFGFQSPAALDWLAAPPHGIRNRQNWVAHSTGSQGT